jgi:flagellar hook protein FlgE
MANAKGLKIVSNNLANVNTPASRGRNCSSPTCSNRARRAARQHVAPAWASRKRWDDAEFPAGADQNTGNPMDLSINGNGMFVQARRASSYYTRSGDFQFNGDNVLVNSAGDHVQALADGGGKLQST